MTSDFISIGELARQTGLSTHTLRYYEAEGVLRPVARAASGHRRYAHEDVLWLAFVLRLKRTDMPIREIRRYAELRAQGDATLPARLTMLQLHRQRLVTRMLELTTCAGALDAKIQTYLAMMDEPPARTRTPNHEPASD
uniref:Regulatory protein, MerR n=1 Tax=mine drainage metagenome TaxID=410659 RepID=E6PLB1_9ZZZZ